VVTTDHRKIQQWAEARGGKPSCVVGTGGGGDMGLLRIDFPGYSGKGSLQEIGWEEFFEKFDEQNLALLYQEQTKGGQRSNFNKLINRTHAGATGPGRSGGKSRSGGSRSGPSRSGASRGGGGMKARSSGSKKSSGGGSGARKSASGASSGGGRAKRKGGAGGRSKARATSARAGRSSGGRAGAGRRRGR
jgi:hypothetical protein